MFLDRDLTAWNWVQVESSSPLPLLTHGYLHFGCKAG